LSREFLFELLKLSALIVGFMGGSDLPETFHVHEVGFLCWQVNVSWVIDSHFGIAHCYVVLFGRASDCGVYFGVFVGL
jgi:hypothetical protein